MITIFSNGSKWNGQDPDTLERLLEVLGTTPLDPSFEDYGNFAYTEDIQEGNVRLFGNFWGVSHVFSIEGTHEELAHVVLAIRANQQTEAYRHAKKIRDEEKRERMERDAAKMARLA